MCAIISTVTIFFLAIELLERTSTNNTNSKVKVDALVCEVWIFRNFFLTSVPLMVTFLLSALLVIFLASFFLYSFFFFFLSVCCCFFIVQ